MSTAATLRTMVAIPATSMLEIRLDAMRYPFWRQSSDRVDLDHCSKMIHPMRCSPSGLILAPRIGVIGAKREAPARGAPGLPWVPLMFLAAAETRQRITSTAAGRS